MTRSTEIHPPHARACGVAGVATTLAAFVPGGVAWAAPTAAEATAGPGALLVGVGVIGLAVGAACALLLRRKPTGAGAAEAGAQPADDAVPSASPAPAPSTAPSEAEDEERAPTNPVDVRCLVETLVLELLEQQAVGELEVGWIARLDATPHVHLAVAPTRALLTELLVDAFARTAQGCITVHLENEPDGRLRIEIEDTATERLAGPQPTWDALAAPLAAELRVQAERGVGSIVSVLLPAPPLPQVTQSASTAPASEPEPRLEVVIDDASPLTLATLETQFQRLQVDLVRQPTGAAPTLRLNGDTVMRAGQVVGTLPLPSAEWQRLLVRPTGRPTRVLIVDDNDSNAFIVERMLAPLQVVTARARTGRAALTAHQQDPFDLVLMDCEMPVWNGIRATAAIRQWEHDQGRGPVPVLITSAHSRARIWPTASAAGATAIVQTPLRREQLEDLLRTWTGATAAGAPDAASEPEGEGAPIGPTDPQAHLDPELFDLGQLSQVLELGPEQFSHLVQVWSHSVKHLRHELRRGITTRDGARVRTAAHTLKSSAASMGLERLRGVFEQIEKLAEMQALGAAGSLLEDADAQFDRAIGQLDAAATAWVVSAPPPPVVPAGDAMRVLVVDDDPFIRSVIKQTLEQGGCTVEVADTGESALRRIAVAPPDLIVMDVQMPGIDGFTACSRVRENAGNADLPVLIMTGHNDVRSVERAFEVGASDFISKPFNPKLLQHRVRFLRRAQLDVRELREKRESIQVLAYTDRVTGLPNRIKLLQELEAAQEELARDGKQPGLAVLFIDLDRFKAVNDSLGHAVGDQLLRAVGRRLRVTLDDHVATRSDLHGQVVARFGGDEFVILLRGATSREIAAQIALPLVEAARKSFRLGPHEVEIGASAGVAVFPHDGLTVDALLTSADNAMYRVKRAGGNGVEAIDTGPGTSEVRRNHTLLDDLRRAIHGDALEIYLQPRVEAQGGTVRSAEALVRWRHPEHGLLLPGAFIPLAEDNGLISALGLRVLGQSLRALGEMDRCGFAPERISVNVSALQLQEPAFADEVLDALRAHDVQPCRLELEVTETAVIDNFNLAVSMLSRLRERGVTIAIDDFGTGHSSLHYLHRLPVDVLKIDRSFVELLKTEAPEEASGPAAIIGMLLALGSALNLRVVAEGVETQEQLTRLCRMGCDELQGFLISRPMPVTRFVEYLRARQRKTA